MRILTIKRTKSFVASLAKMKVYIESDEQNDLTINSKPCKFLGKLGNGEEVAFEIGDEASRVYVIADKLSKGFCNEFYDIPEGTEDIRLTGKNRLNPASGNAFRFDGVENEEVLKNRKRSSRNGTIILISAVVIGFLVGILILSPILMLFKDNMGEPTTFAENGLTITLTDKFEPYSSSKFTAAFQAEDMAVFAIEEHFARLSGSDNYSVEDYAKIVAVNNGLTGEDVTVSGDLTFVEFIRTTAGGESYYYFISMYKEKDAFWMIQFTCAEENSDEYCKYFLDWARTASFE